MPAGLKQNSFERELILPGLGELACLFFSCVWTKMAGFTRAKRMFHHLPASGGIALSAPPTGFWKAGWLRASPLRRSCSSLDWSHVAKGKEILCWAPEPGVTNGSHQCATGSMIWTELRTVANFLLNTCCHIGTINWERPDFKEKKQFFFLITKVLHLYYRKFRKCRQTQRRK